MIVRVVCSQHLLYIHQTCTMSNNNFTPSSTASTLSPTAPEWHGSPSLSTTSTLSSTAPKWNGIISNLIPKINWRGQQIDNFKASTKRENSLALSAESSSDSMEEYLAIKYYDRQLTAQRFLLEKEIERIYEEIEWNDISTLLEIETENVLEIERERFRSEPLKDEQQLPIILQKMIGMESQIEEVELTERLLAEFGEQKHDDEEEGPIPSANVSLEKIENLIKEQRRIAVALMKKKLAAGKDRRIILAEWPPLPSILEEDELA
ncbi:hypothetical protein BDZ45DRAFT_789295 [Acephala macrosclerotiorum]|nr:hypothetical protein BDZ45DRAFT_789295 [Acephala macrosclerotiorum]